MDFSMTQEQTMLKSSVRDFLGKEVQDTSCLGSGGCPPQL
jgi:hypothetical protein